MYFGISFWVSCWLSSSLVPSFLRSLFGYYITYWFLPHSLFFFSLSLSLFACNRKYDLMYCFSQSIHQHTSKWFWQGHVMLSAQSRAMSRCGVRSHFEDTQNRTSSWTIGTMTWPCSWCVTGHVGFEMVVTDFDDWEVDDKLKQAHTWASCKFDSIQVGELLKFTQ